MEEKIILVVNDDGITAPGIKNLVEAVKHLGRVVVVAPNKPQSGMGHAITINTPLRINPNHLFEGIESYECNGTPADCVKIAKTKIIKGKVDICVSGINHGTNHAINVLYSGTMSAAMEGCLENIPSIGFSFENYDYEADFTEVRKYVSLITQKVLDTKNIPCYFLLNVNFPFLKEKEKFKGIKICKQAFGRLKENYTEGIDPSKKRYFWLSGEFDNLDKSEDSDANALKQKYVSIVPTQFDMTNYELKKDLEQVEKWGAWDF